MSNLDGLIEGQVLVVDDSADDIEMLGTHPRALLVQNFDDERGSLHELMRAFLALPENARGLVEGIDQVCGRAAVPG